MKKISLQLNRLAFIGMMLFTANLSSAQTPIETGTTTTTTTSAGTVSTFTPDTIVVKSTTSAAPETYSYTKTTTYVDELGNPVSVETVKSGAPVTVYYDRDGTKMVATKVVVRKSTVIDANSAMAKETTATTTSAGTVSQFGPDTIVVKSTTSAAPESYSYSKTTTYVDENGNTVSSETVKSGAPVTVYYTKDGDKMVATKVIVRKTTTTTTP